MLLSASRWRRGGRRPERVQQRRHDRGTDLIGIFVLAGQPAADLDGTRLAGHRRPSPARPLFRYLNLNPALANIFGKP